MRRLLPLRDASSGGKPMCEGSCSEEPASGYFRAPVGPFLPPSYSFQAPGQLLTTLRAEMADKDTG